MKKLLPLLLLAVTFSCSTSEDENAMCCGYTIEQIKESYSKMYAEILANDDITAQQRIDAEADLERKLEDPCFYFKRSSQGECD